MAFLDWFAPISPVAREDGCNRVFSADLCPLSYSFWVVEDDRASTTPSRPDVADRAQPSA